MKTEPMTITPNPSHSALTAEIVRLREENRRLKALLNEIDDGLSQPDMNYSQAVSKSWLKYLISTVKDRLNP